nr:hypothetical protein [Tanacetum cinerariifolium]
LKDLEARNQGPTRTMVIRKPDSGRIQSFLEVQGQGKKKIIDKQVAYTFLDLDTPKNKSATDQYILHRHTLETAKPTGPSSQPVDEGFTMTNSETKFNEAGSNPRKQDEGQARSNPKVTNASTQQNLKQMDDEFTTTAYLNEENIKLPTEDHVILEKPASSTRKLSSLQNLDKELSFTYQFFMKKPQEEEPEKTNVDLEVQSMVMRQRSANITPDLITLWIRPVNLICLEDEDGRGGGSYEDPEALEAPEAPTLLEKVEEEVEIQNEFLVNLISFDASYELRPDLLEVDPNVHDPLTFPVLRRGSCDLYGFCRTQFPIFVVEESLLCQL